MDYRLIEVSETDKLWKLQKAYKAAIHEDLPDEQDRGRLALAMKERHILFFGAWEGEDLVGCCSVTVGFSTFNYRFSGVFEDFYIIPEYRHRGIARQLVQCAYRDNGVSSLTVGCADCDKAMYQALGFAVPLGNLLAYE